MAASLEILNRPQPSQGARLDRVDGSVVPVTIQTRNFAVSVEPYDVGVGNASHIAFLDNSGDIRRHRSADQGLDHNGVVLGFNHLDDFGSKIGDGFGEAAPYHLEPAADRHDAVFAIG